MSLTEKVSKHNFNAFLWHAGFLAFAQNFMDVDTVIPAMVVEAGGSALQIGIMSAIMLGGSSFTQLFFAPFVSSIPYKKNYLLTGINLRVFSLFALAFVLYWLSINTSYNSLWFIFLFITIFSLSGAFANISYVDILGKSINQDKRKLFFSARQINSGIVVFLTAFLARKILSTYNFPGNYSILFLIGGASLLIASAGFWSIRETEPSGMSVTGLKSFMNSMSSEIKNNKRLIYFLGFINTQGIVLSFIPFVILYAKETFNTQAADTGIFLLFKVIGVVSMSFMVLILSKRIKYNILLYSNVFLTLLLASLIMLVPDADSLKLLFILGGITVSLYAITMNGVLLEISGNENRALYAGFAGAGNIVPALFPLVAGGIINRLGYHAFFLIFIALVGSSLFFIYKIKCRK